VRDPAALGSNVVSTTARTCLVGPGVDRCPGLRSGDDRDAPRHLPQPRAVIALVSASPLVRAAGMVVLALLLAACSRGPTPPSPTEDLVPTQVGVIASTDETMPVRFSAGGEFAPPPGATVDRIWNWPSTESTHWATNPDRLSAGTLLLGGQRPDGSWWYQLADFASNDGCHRIAGGSFDEGDSVRLSSGLRLPKAPGFEIRDHGSGVQAFPGHQADVICIDEQGRAVFFDLAIGM
jgi:hypothetical protein